MTDEEAIQAATAAQNPNVNAPPPPLPKEAEGWMKTLSPGLFENYQQMETLWNHPAAQFSVMLVKDPAFRGAVTEINQKFQKNTVLGYELAWVLLIWILRAWRLSKAGTWLTRIWVQLWVSQLFWAGALFLVPWLLWGKSYQMVLATVFRALIHQF
jgi:hypothetical protein